ncbi:hypothetical protein XENOCAPTIV_019243 [Xenoophorus captivus]|uniref:ZP domain-containing protein n=1 Tax=Xenoophorus captivus TaxID=1517983 RepID=A0ABV0QJ58_9TELE
MHLVGLLPVSVLYSQYCSDSFCGDIVHAEANAIQHRRGISIYSVNFRVLLSVQQNTHDEALTFECLVAAGSTKMMNFIRSALRKTSLTPPNHLLCIHACIRVSSLH